MECGRVEKKRGTEEKKGGESIFDEDCVKEQRTSALKVRKQGEGASKENFFPVENNFLPLYRYLGWIVKSKHPLSLGIPHTTSTATVLLSGGFASGTTARGGSGYNPAVYGIPSHLYPWWVFLGGAPSVITVRVGYP